MIGVSRVTHTNGALRDTMNGFPENPLFKPGCLVCKALSNFCEGDVDMFEDYLASGYLTHQNLADALGKHGYSVSEATIRRHKSKCMEGHNG